VTRESGTIAPPPGTPETLTATRKRIRGSAKHGDHFTNSAGLIAAHPMLDAMCDEYPSIAWYLRARVFERFGYDPGQVFSL
jgi:hypothetical protein